LYHDFVENALINGGNSDEMLEICGLRKNGSQFPLEIAISQGYLKEQKLAVLVARDITERQKTEAELRQREQFLVALNDISRDALDAPDLPSIYKALAGRLRHLFGADRCYFAQWDEEHQTVLPAAIVGVDSEIESKYLGYRIDPDEQTLAGHVLITGQPLTVEDIQNNVNVNPGLAKIYGDQALLSIPFIAGSKKLGAAVVAYQTPHKFTAVEVTWAERVSQQVALALARVQLLEETNLRLRETETLRQAAAAVSESLSLDKRVTRILEQLSQVVPYDSASVQLLRDNYLEIVNGHGFKHPEQLIGLRFSTEGNNINARVVKEKRPLILADVEVDFADYFAPPHGNIRSWMGVPLIVREHLVGMLTVDSFEGDYFTQTHVRSVVPFANQMAIALENASLYEQAREDANTKAVLLREVNHRVKNNLSAIIGLMYAERRHPGVKDDTVFQDIMRDLINRVKGLSVVHNMLSASEWAPLPLADMSNTLVNTALQPLPPNKKVTVRVSPSHVHVSAKQANNLALIINELATNTAKYALPGKEIVNIGVTITTDNDRIRLEYRDDGPGYPDSTLHDQQYSVGLYLAHTLVRDGLVGQLSLRNENGAVAVIDFKLSTKPGRVQDSGHSSQRTFNATRQ
jgi:two-component sensor histidine kinase